MSEKKSEKALLTIYNRHVASCGTPPALEHTAASPHYCGYFENDYGEQWLFIYDQATQQATLRGGDAEWENVYSVLDGVASGLILNRAEQTWLSACWAAATGQPVQETPIFSDILAGKVSPQKMVEMLKPGIQRRR